MNASTTYSPTVGQARFIALAVANYRAADVAGKASIRATLNVGQRRRLGRMDLFGSATYAAAVDAIAAAKSPTKVAVDPNQVIADRIATLRLAADLMEAGIVAPEGFDPIAYPEARGVADVHAAFTLGDAKVTRSAKVSSVQDVIDAAFADQPVGTFLKVSEICNAAGYAHPGAVSARLFPKKGDMTLVGVEAVDATATTPKGARKVA